MMLLFLPSCRDNGPGDNPVAGETVLQLKTASGVDFDWKAAPNALVNGASCKITLSEGSPAIGVEASSAGEYEIIIPAEAYSRARKCFVLPPAQIPSASGAARPTFFPYACTDRRFRRSVLGTACRHSENQCEGFRKADECISVCSIAERHIRL